MALTQQNCKKLKVGDLIEWSNIDRTKPNWFGVIMQSHTFRNGNPQTMKFHQVLIKWNNHKDICTYNEFDFLDLQNFTLIAEAKQ